MAAEGLQVCTKSHQTIDAASEHGFFHFLCAVRVQFRSHFPVRFQPFLDRNNVSKHNNGHQQSAPGLRA